MLGFRLAALDLLEDEDTDPRTSLFNKSRTRTVMDLKEAGYAQYVKGYNSNCP